MDRGDRLANHPIVAPSDHRCQTMSIMTARADLPHERGHLGTRRADDHLN